MASLFLTVGQIGQGGTHFGMLPPNALFVKVFSFQKIEVGRIVVFPFDIQSADVEMQISEQYGIWPVGTLQEVKSLPQVLLPFCFVSLANVSHRLAFKSADDGQVIFHQIFLAEPDGSLVIFLGLFQLLKPLVAVADIGESTHLFFPVVRGDKVQGFFPFQEGLFKISLVLKGFCPLSNRFIP